MNYATQYPRLWRLFFWFLVANVAWTLLDGVISSSTSFWKAAIGSAFSILFLIPIHGYIWQRAYHPRWLWHVLKWWSILLFAFAIFVAGYALSRVFAIGPLPLLAAVAGLLSEYFYFFAVDQYLAHSSHLWSEDRTNNFGQTAVGPAE